MNDPRLELLADLDNSKTRVVNGPGYIVICGGTVSVLPGQEHCSARNIFLAELAASQQDLQERHLLPEQFAEWNDFGVYRDLLAFETDLAHLTGAVVLFVESAGAIAELGSFSCIRPLAEKLIVVIRDDYYHADSFIRLGPVQYLEDHYPGSVFVYDWKADNSDFDANNADLVSAIRSRMELPSKSEAFSPSSIKHELLLIADVIDLFVAVKEHELKEWLERYFGVALEQARVRQFLFLLLRLGFIREAPYGNNRYFVASKNATPYIVYGTVTGTFKQERARLKARVLEYYAETDKTRMYAWRNAQHKMVGGSA